MNIYVGPEGAADAKIVLIGEAPAREEERERRPFVGSAGRYLNKFIRMAGLVRDELYLTNISKYRVPSDKIGRLDPQALKMCQEELIAEINELENPEILVPLGNYPLKAITDKSGITNFRGSVLHPKESIKHDCIVIPSFHPSILHYANYDQWPLIVADLSKVKRIRDQGFKFPEYNFIVQPTLEKIRETLEWLVATQHKRVAIDVETPHRLLSCIGLAWSRSEGICIPFYWGSGRDYWTLEEEHTLWKMLAEYLPQLNLCGQNTFFDWEIMRDHGIELKPPIWDSMLMHACLYSEMRHNLETILSIYTDMTFYKRDEDDETKRSSIRAGMEHDHWEYNMYDCVGCLWAIEELEKDLIEEEMLDVYMNLYAEMLEPYLELNIRGVPVDTKKLPAVREDIKKGIVELEKKIEKEVGHPLNVKSPKQVSTALYDELGWKPYYKRGTKTRTTDKKALEKLAYKYQSELPIWIAGAKEDYSFLSLFDENNIENGCFRCSYSLARTKTGRLSSRKSYSGKGRNLQNVKTGMPRTFFIPESGHVIIGADQRQAEARLTAYYSTDENYIAAAESGKLYLAIGERVYDEPGFQKSDPRYRIVKSLVHGTNYRMTPFGFSRAANIPLAQAKVEHATFHERFPGIKNVYYKYVENCINKTRMIYNPFGRRQVFFKKIDESVYKAGSAFIPQSASSDLTKMALKKASKYYRILLDLHDGFYMSVPKGEEKYGIECILEAYNIPIPIFGTDRYIPVDVSIGPNWGEMEEVEG